MVVRNAVSAKNVTCLWELRSTMNTGIARIFFAVSGDQIVLLHAFVKKSGRTPLRERRTAESRLAILRG